METQMENWEKKERENRTVKCEDCQKNWYGWAVDDNLGCCPDCKRPLD